MAYSSEKDTTNPFLSKIQDIWKDFLKFKGDTLIEKIVRSISVLVVLCIFVFLIPFGILISIYNSFYNLQKKSHDALLNSNSTNSQFVSGVEFGIYFLLSIPFWLLLIPYWIIAYLVIRLVNSFFPS